MTFSSFNNRTRSRLLLCALPLILLLTSCGDKPKQNVVPPRPVRVAVATSAASGAELLQTGEIRAHTETHLAFRLDGRLLSREVDIGSRVKAGELLATLESDSSQNQLTSARADQASARAAERVAALNLHRMKQLMPSGAIARAQLDSAQGDWQAALSRRESSDAALKNAQNSLAWTHLIAPEDGVITAVNASTGQVVSSGTAIFTLAAEPQRDAVVDVADPQAFARTPGASFTVSLLADPRIQAQGQLRDISPQADPQTRTWRLRITLDNPPEAMALGASVQIALTRTTQHDLSLPASALTRSGGRPAVFVVDPTHHTLQLRPIVLSRFTTTDIMISSGVKAGEQVVTAGVSKLRQGEKVALDEAQP